MATTALQNLVSSDVERKLVNRVIWAVFNAEKQHLHLKIAGIFSFDAAPLVATWLTTQFGPEPTDNTPLVTGDDASAFNTSSS